MTSFIGYVENIKEALFLLGDVDACCNGLLPMRKTRLGFKEKMDLSSGSVYIFSQGDSGICRWTDGKFWTPSRFQDGFLVYWELETTPCDSVRPLSSHSTDSITDTIATKNQKRYRIKQGGLIKKAISVETPYYGTLQLVSYFTELDVSLGFLRSPTSFVV